MELVSVPLDPLRLGNYDLVVIVTDHTSVDYASVVKNAKHILDTRNSTKGLGATNVTLL